MVEQLLDYAIIVAPKRLCRQVSGEESGGVRAAGGGEDARDQRGQGRCATPKGASRVRAASAGP
jgi:hypothetical protein